MKERDLQAFESEEATRKREAAAEERKKQSHNMVGEFIKRTLDESKSRFSLIASKSYSNLRETP